MLILDYIVLVEEIFWATFKNAFEGKDRLAAILNIVKSQANKLLC